MGHAIFPRLVLMVCAGYAAVNGDLAGEEIKNVVVTFSSEGTAAIGNFSGAPILLHGRTDGGGFSYSYSADKYIGGSANEGWESFFAWDWCGTGRTYGTREIKDGEVYEFPEPYHLAKGHVKIAIYYEQGGKSYRSDFRAKNEYGPEILTITETRAQREQDTAKKDSDLERDFQNYLTILRKIGEISDLERRKQRVQIYMAAVKESHPSFEEEILQLARGELALADDLLKRGYKEFPPRQRSRVPVKQRVP